MASFSILDNEARDHTASTSQNTTASFTPAVGDIVFWYAHNSVNVGADAAVTGGGMTWTKIAEARQGSDVSTCFAFRASAGTPSAGVLTLSCASDNFIDTCYAIVRPVDLTYVGVAGTNTTNAATADTLTVTLTTSSPAALLAYGAAGSVVTFAQDTGWTETMDQNIASGRAHQLQERFSDDSEVIIDASGNSIMFGIGIEFSAVGGAGVTDTGERGVRRGIKRGERRGIVHRMKYNNGIYRPANLGLSLAGA